jgi:hypothetical protein
MTDLKAIASQIADQLGETEATPRVHIRRILYAIGPERTQAFVAQALEVEANGGMLLPDGSRKRTLGGVFFRLVRDHLSEEETQAIWPWTGQERKPHWKAQQRKATRAAPTPAQLPPFQCIPLPRTSVLDTPTISERLRAHKPIHGGAVHEMLQPLP